DTVAARRNGPPPRAVVAYGCGRPATCTSRSSAASATVRAMGPATDSPPGLSRPDAMGTLPREGLRPTTPTVAAGMRIDPPPSDAGARGRSPAATAVAAPPLEPPAPFAGFHGSR